MTYQNKMVTTETPAYRATGKSCPDCGGVLYSRKGANNREIRFCKRCPYKR